MSNCAVSKVILTLIPIEVGEKPNSPGEFWVCPLRLDIYHSGPVAPLFIDYHDQFYYWDNRAGDGITHFYRR